MQNYFAPMQIKRFMLRTKILLWAKAGLANLL